MKSCISYHNLNETHILTRTTNPTKLPSYQQPSAPGKITGRSCAYFGARWILAPLRDAIHLVHGPIGCAYYGSTVRAKTYRLFSTALEEKDIVFGGEKKLAKAIREAKTIMPEAKYIFVYITCSTALIGDDVNSICKSMEKELSCPIVVVNCPGFKGQSEAVGHKIAYECLLNRFIGQRQRCIGPYDVNIIGQYNVNETKIIKSLLSKMGINVHCIFTANAPYEKITTAHRVKLNLLICQNSGRFFAENMQEKYEVPYLKVSFLGISQSMDSLRRIGQYFNLKKEAETVIDEEYKAIKPQLAQFLPQLKGKKAAVFLGAARVADLIKTLQDLGMDVVFVGTRFGNTINYRDIRQTAKINPVRDNNKDAIRRSKISNGAKIHIIDDPSEQNLENLFCKLRPDVFITGIKEQSLCHKFGIGSLLPQMGAYAGFKGSLALAQNLYKAIYAPVWQMANSQQKGLS